MGGLLGAARDVFVKKVALLWFFCCEFFQAYGEHCLWFHALLVDLSDSSVVEVWYLFIYFDEFFEWIGLLDGRNHYQVLDILA